MDGDEGLAFRFKTDEQRSAIEYEATHLTSASAHDHGAGGN